MGELFEALLGGAGWGLGIGAAIGAASLAGKGLRPVVKEAIKLGLTAGTRVQEWTAEMREQMDDIVAEARSEQEAETPPGEAGGAGHVVTPSRAAASSGSRSKRAES